MNDTPDLTKPDALGRPHDPAKFLPKLDSLGRWVNRNTGRPRKHPGKTPFRARKTPPANESQPEPMQTNEHTPPPAPPATPPASTPPGASQPTPEMNIGGTINFDDIEKAAGSTPLPESGGPPVTGEATVIESVTTETIIGIIQTALVMIGDDEGILTKTEKEMLRAPLKRVLDKYDVGEKALPAEVDLAVCMATLLMVRLQKPKTATWFAKAKAWFVRTFFRAKGEALARKMRREVGDIPVRETAAGAQGEAAK